MPKLKLFLDDLEDAPEALREHYTENPEGGFMLTFEDKLVPERKLTALQTKLDKMKDYVSPDVVTDLQTQLDAAKNEGDVETKVANRVKELQSEWATKETELTGKLSTYESQISQAAIKQALTEAASRAGVKATAIEDVLLRGNQTFKYVDGNLKAFNGAEERFHKGTEAYTPEHFMGELKKNATHLFEENVGGGAIGSIKAKPAASQQRPMSALERIQSGLASGQ